MLSKTPERIARVLATEVRVMSAKQIAEHFYDEMKKPIECAHRAVRKLEKLDFGRSWQTTVTHLDITAPIFCWNPNRPISYSPPAIAWQNTKRWNTARLERTVCITSTKKSRAHFGGSCRPPRNRELEHDINVAGLFLQIKRNNLEMACSWKHEDSFTRDNSIRPDATVIETDGALVVLDLLGRGYSAAKIAGIIHRHSNVRMRLY